MIEKLGHRIAIIGPSCSGKSTLAVDLGQKLGLPVHHLDRLRWSEGGEAAFPGKVQSLLADENWIIEGCYVGVLPDLLERATNVIYLDYSRFLCFWRLVRRSLQQRRGSKQIGRGGDDKNSLDWQMVDWVLHHYPRFKKPRIDRLLRETTVRSIWAKTPKQLNASLSRYQK